MKRSYYSAQLIQFLREDSESILGKLAASHQFDLDNLQRNAWVFQIDFLKRELQTIASGYVCFEYSIPRMGKRVDNILIANGLVYILEFKVGSEAYHRHDVAQVLDYALDLKYFHGGSKDIPLVPILIATNGPAIHNNREVHPDNIWEPICLNQTNFGSWLRKSNEHGSVSAIDPIAWESSEYHPTPTIIEAAQVMYEGHNVQEISRSEAENLSDTTEAISSIIDDAKARSAKAICFLTGVPGSGKTLAGLNIANARQQADANEHAVFLSGNGPLVRVLQEALARSEANNNESVTKKEALTRTRAFIQNIHHFRDEGIISVAPPVERVVIFDEAQRAWTKDKTQSFMAQKKGYPNFNKSEPEFLIEIVDRHNDWAVIVCLIGGGQEINTGEAGLPEWFHAISDKFEHWEVYVSDQLTENEYNQGQDLFQPIDSHKLKVDRRLHLSTSIRSFRSENLSNFVKALLDSDVMRAIQFKRSLGNKYPLFLTRHLDIAKDWVRSMARGTERYGLISSSGALRLRPFGINVKANIDPTNWFLNDSYDVRSSFYLEEVATEFDIQGLELDWTIVGWDADLRFNSGDWEYWTFRGTEWNSVRQQVRQLYLKNAYRVLLTRARQGMILFIPEGDRDDRTREPKYYDGTYQYLIEIGIEEI